MTTSTNDSHIILTDHASREARVKRLRLFADTPGLAAKNFDSVVNQLADNDELFVFGYGEAAAAVRKDGSLFSHGDAVSRVSTSTNMDGVEESTTTVERMDLRGFANTCHSDFVAGVDAPPPGSVPLNKIVNGLSVSCGVVLIIAGGGAGKTPLAHGLAGAGVSSYSIARVGEPHAGYARTQRGAARELARAARSRPDVVLDSIKDLLSSGGAAMKSGLSREALVVVSGWASLACELGRTLYVPVNPSTSDPEVLELLGEISRSNASMTILNKSPGVWTYAGRTGEGLERRSGLINTKFKDGTITFTATAADTPEEFDDELTKTLNNIALTTEAWSQAQRRALNRN